MEDDTMNEEGLVDPDEEDEEDEFDSHKEEVGWEKE